MKLDHSGINMGLTGLQARGLCVEANAAQAQKQSSEGYTSPSLHVCGAVPG